MGIENITKSTTGFVFGHGKSASLIQTKLGELEKKMESKNEWAAKEVLNFAQEIGKPTPSRRSADHAELCEAGPGR